MKIINNLIVSFIFLFQYTYSQVSFCGSFLPKDENSCSFYSTNETFCCLLRTYSNGLWSQTCYPFNNTDYLQLNDQINLFGYQYSIVCDIETGTTCGNIETPQSYQDCGQFSTNLNSCCYYKYNGDSSCVWLGTPDVGQLEYNGLTLICKSSFIQVSLTLLILLLIFYY